MIHEGREGLNHAHITVPFDELSKAREFYLGLLGLTEVEKPEELKIAYTSFWVQLANCELHIGGQHQPIDRWASGAHLAIQVHSLEDLLRRKARLEAAGTETSEMGRYIGFQRFEFRDPWGNRLELITPDPAYAKQ
jgi:catechol 2,3-dioxygenase-like lactoylglutathione lyase family enzyme